MITENLSQQAGEGAVVSSRPGQKPWGVGIPSAQLGLWIFLATVSMFFAAFLSAYIVRRSAADWVPITLPPILWINSAVLLASSATLEAARAARRNPRHVAALSWLLATALLGFLFLLGQIAAWQQLVRRGVYIPTSPHSSFFYIFTGLHGLHLIGGLALLFYVSYRVWRIEDFSKLRVYPNLVSLCATYWHFLGGLWIFLFIILSSM